MHVFSGWNIVEARNFRESYLGAIDWPTNQDDESELRAEDSSSESNEAPPKSKDGTITNRGNRDTTHINEYWRLRRNANPWPSLAIWQSVSVWSEF